MRYTHFEEAHSGANCWMKTEQLCRSFAYSCAILLVFLYIFNLYFQDREHVIFHILLIGKVSSTLLPNGGSDLPNGVEWERYLLTFFDDLEGQLMFFVLF